MESLLQAMASANSRLNQIFSGERGYAMEQRYNRFMYSIENDVFDIDSTGFLSESITHQLLTETIQSLAAYIYVKYRNPPSGSRRLTEVESCNNNQIKALYELSEVKYSNQCSNTNYTRNLLSQLHTRYGEKNAWKIIAVNGWHSGNPAPFRI